MGLKIGRLFKKAAPFIGAAAGAFFGGPPGATAGFRAGAALRPTSKAAAFAGVGAGVPSIQGFTGVPAFLPLPAGGPMVQTNGGVVVPAAAGMPALAAGLSRAVIGAIVKLAGTLGLAVTAQNIGRVGLRLWRSVTALARRYPGVSILTFLVGLGLTADEAGEFLFWGQAKRRRRRGGGISGRDIRITKRTLRRLSIFRARVGAPSARRHRRRSRGDGTVVVAQQD